jgi:hypothetical protein
MCVFWCRLTFDICIEPLLVLVSAWRPFFTTSRFVWEIIHVCVCVCVCVFWCRLTFGVSNELLALVSRWRTFFATARFDWKIIHYVCVCFFWCRLTFDTCIATLLLLDVPPLSCRLFFAVVVRAPCEIIHYICVFMFQHTIIVANMAIVSACEYNPPTGSNAAIPVYGWFAGNCNVCCNIGYFTFIFRILTICCGGFMLLLFPPFWIPPNTLALSPICNCVVLFDWFTMIWTVISRLLSLFVAE